MCFWARKITVAITTRSQKCQLTRLVMGSAWCFREVSSLVIGSLIVEVKTLFVRQEVNIDWVMGAF